MKGTRSPVAVLTATPTSGQAPLTVRSRQPGTYDPDPGESISFAWDFTNDGTVDSADPNPSFTYTTNGDLHGQADGDRLQRQDGGADARSSRSATPRRR